MIIIKNINTPNNTNDQTPPSRLQLLITAAQSGDRQALLQLCEDFSPLLKSEAHREMFYRSLGKDAEGIAVLALIELILKYDGADFANWPGLARCKVHFALFDAMQKQGQIWENEAQVDTKAPPGPNCWRPAVMLTAAWTSWPGFYCRWICRKLCVS